MQDFRKLEVWQLAHSVMLAVYRLSKAFPADEKYSLTDQMRRAAVSIEANLAEGTGRGGDADFARFVQIAFGSACELECAPVASARSWLSGCEATRGDRRFGPARQTDVGVTASEAEAESARRRDVVFAATRNQ